jgi:deoxyribose-phosphate aldolase
MALNIEQIEALADEYRDQLPSQPASLTPGPVLFNKMIDHTLLKPEATPGQVQQLCKEAGEYHFASVCINPIYVSLASKLLHGTDVAICTVIGFPLGATPWQVKVFEAKRAMRSGATEIDMVIPIGLLKGAEYKEVFTHIQTVVEASHKNNALVKVILEMAFLDRRQKIIACLLAQSAGADFVKTSTGFGPGGATREDVALMRCIVGKPDQMGVKAAGGIRTLADAMGMIEAGANRLGTSSGVRIMHEAQAGNG